MRKYISVFISGALAVLLCSCGSADSTNNGAANTSVSESINSEESSAAKEADVSDSSPSETDVTIDENFTVQDLDPACEYAEIRKCETKYGNILYPVLNTGKLNADDAKAANALFEYIKDMLLADIKELDELPEEIASDESVRPPSSHVHISLYGNILSVLMSYEYTFGNPGTYYKSVIFDVSTGKAVSSDEAAKAVSLTSADVKDSILWFSKIYQLNLRDINYISGLADTGELPEFNSHDGLTNYEKVLCETALDNYDKYDEYSEIDNAGKPWENLPLSHTAYLDERGQLYVFGTVFPDSEIAGMMVAIAHGEEEIAAANYRGRFNPIVRKRYFELSYAEQAAAGIADPEIIPSFAVECVTEVYDIDMDRTFPAYSVNVFSNTGFAPALVGKYAVGIFDSFIWEMDDDGDWKKTNAPFALNEDSARDSGALAAIWRPEESPEPFCYQLWAAKPVYEIYLGSTDRITPAEHIKQNCCCALVYALYDADIAFLEDARDGSGFALYKSIKLNAGEFAAVYFVAEDDPTEAVEIATGFDKGTFILTNNIYGKEDQPVLVFPDESYDG